MSRYRRANSPGATYFFTLITYRRQPILCDKTIRVALRESLEKVRVKRPFKIDAWVLLPDHLHCIWTLPICDAYFSLRWSLIKRNVSLSCGDRYKRSDWLNVSKQKHRESTLWQRRFWEHQIRDETDFEQHMNYIHYNPVKHDLCKAPLDWPFSSFHRHVLRGAYPENWSVGSNEQLMGEFGE